MATASTSNWTRENLAWLSGLLEGDGCFTTGSQVGYLRVECAMSDLDVLDRAKDVAGMGNISGPYAYGIGSKTMYRWHVTNTQNAYALMAALYPWLGNRRQERISELVKSYKTVGPVAAKKTHCKRDHEFTEENTYIDARGCRNCRACKKWRANGYS